MDTLSIQDLADDNTSQASSDFKPRNEIHSPLLVSQQTQANSLDTSRRQSRNDEIGHLISTNDILNHDYNQMKIEEGRTHRMNLKKECSNLKNNEDNDLFITHVTLNLDVIANRPTSGSTWKYNTIKRNNSSINTIKAQNAGFIRQKLVEFDLLDFKQNYLLKKL